MTNALLFDQRLLLSKTFAEHTPKIQMWQVLIWTFAEQTIANTPPLLSRLLLSRLLLRRLLLSKFLRHKPSDARASLFWVHISSVGEGTWADWVFFGEFGFNFWILGWNLAELVHWHGQRGPLGLFFYLTTRGPSLYSNQNPKLAVLGGQMAKIRTFCFM